MSSVYVDRKMLKWLPFQSLNAQGDDLKALYDDQFKRTKPVLSEDELVLLQYQFEEAFYTQSVIQVDVYTNDTITTYTGTITEVDSVSGYLTLNAVMIKTTEIIAIK